MSVTYKPAATSTSPPPPEPDDSVDLTNVIIRVDGSGTRESQSTSATCWSSIAARVAQSTVVRYLVVLAIFALVIFLLERFLGTAAPQELRSALVDGVKEALQKAVLSNGFADSSVRPPQQVATN